MTQFYPPVPSACQYPWWEERGRFWSSASVLSPKGRLDWDLLAGSPLWKPLGGPVGGSGCRCGVRGNPQGRLELMYLMDLCKDVQELVDAGVVGQM